MSKIVFWDSETTGLHKAFHQPVEIGGVVTDGTLTPQREFEIIFRPSIFVLPDPGALTVTGRSISELMSRPMSTHTAMKKFADEVQQDAGTCFVTYNGISFDDPMIEHAFYRNLLDPYCLKKNRNTRIDMLKLLHVAHVLARGALAIPNAADGKLSFKLEAVAPANGFEHSNAHSASADARATMHLATLMAARAPEIWRRAMNVWSRKEAVGALLAPGRAVVLFEWDAKARKPHFKVLLSLGPRPDYSGEFLCIDTGIEPSNFAALSSTALVDEITRGSVRRPICPVRLNKMPIVFPLNDPAIATFIPPDAETRLARARPLAKDSNFCDRVMEAATLRQDGFPDSEHVEEQLYSGGFFGNADTLRLARFHRADPEQKLRLVDQFDDGRLRTLGLRVVIEEHSASVSAELRARIDTEVAHRMHAGDGAPWTTISSALAEIAKASVLSSGRKHELLVEYRQYLIDLSGIGRAAE